MNPSADLGKDPSRPGGGPAAPEWGSLVDVLDWRAAAHPDRVAFTFLRDGVEPSGRLTFGDLGRRARAAGAALRRRGVAGERVLLLYPQGLDFVTAFFAVLHAGAVAVPAPAPQGGRAAQARVASIAADARPALALAPAALAAEAEAILHGTGIPVAGLEGGEDGAEGEGAGLAPRPGRGDLALLQYTSGSTGTPRGVMVSHGNILHNQELIRLRFEHDERTVFVSWLPMFHDMGLIGTMLQPVHVGCSCVLMPPVAFLQEPARWLRAIARWRGTTAGAPNFAYDLCVDRIADDQRDGLDLSSWDVAFNGAEPVRARTLARFADAFAPHGFRPEAFYPCYGMAEATLLIAGGRKGRRPTLRDAGGSGGGDGAGGLDGGGRALVGCGATGLGQEILIVDPDSGRPLPDGEVGEIWLRGGSVAQGYWNRPEDTAASFGARPAGAGEGGGAAPGAALRTALRTGDLGLVEGGEVFVAGRLKDVLIVRGRNHYPQDVEATVQASHPGLRPDCGAAFLVEDEDRQALVVVQELSRVALRAPPLGEIARAVRAAVSREHGLHVAAVVLLRTGGLPKTSSGKVQRRLCRARYLAGDLAVEGEDRMGPPLRAAPPGGAVPGATILGREAAGTTVLGRTP